MKARIQSGLRARASLASCAAVLLPLFAGGEPPRLARGAEPRAGQCAGNPSAW
jgi:hypothetical protein